MKVVVISSSPLIRKKSDYYAYSPYVKELELWARHSDEIAFLCPVWKEDRGLLISKIAFPISKMFEANEFNITTIGNLFRAFLYSFRNFFKIFESMLWADHIHLRCPGNIGLMGCIVQILFPSKPKTAKYAGNWDPDAVQPWSYKLQRWILGNTFLTKNMQVLVYGEWKQTSKNIKSFFTATYKEADKTDVEPRQLNDKISFLFVGTLSEGKRPFYAIRLVEKLKEMGFDVALQLYGDGKQKEILQQYCNKNQLESIIDFMGNQTESVVRDAYKESHFILLPSESEGWPKVIAEGMFWGCLPIATKVSCVANMLGYGNRGILITVNLEEDAQKISALLNDQQLYNAKVHQSILWSRKYTLDLFESEIKALINS